MAAALLVVQLVGPTVAWSGDWPQWRGPNRDGNFPEKGLLKEWPADGPKLAWKAEKLGKGMASVSVADGVIYTTAGRSGGQYLVALDAKTGKLLWKAALGGRSMPAR